MEILVLELLTIAVITIIVSVIASFVVFIDFAKNNWRRRFRQQIRLGIASGNFTYNDMQHIAERWSQDRKAILLSLRIMHSDAVAGEDDKLTDSVEKLRYLIHEHQKIEPFAELPENVSLQLSSLQRAVDSSEKIDQLAASLSSLYASNQNELQKQKKFTLWGFIIGTLGFVVGLVSLYATYNAV
ncbi:hypothetical protein [Idiomarina abyssalis]|uniref:hypothetical protein n=1 Tax=Idiomarina abyssalis TaxID=86102 RepID=UPI003A93C8F7